MGPKSLSTSHSKPISRTVISTRTASSIRAIICALIFANLFSGSPETLFANPNVSSNPLPQLSLSLGHAGGVTYVSVSSDGNIALSSGDDGFAILWYIASGQELRRFRDPGGAIYFAGLSGDGRLAATCGESGNVLVWDTESGSVKARFPGFHLISQDDVPEGGCAFSSDGTRLYSTANNRPYLFDVAADESIRLKGYIPPQNSDMTSFGGAAFSSDSQYLAASMSNAVYLWNARTGDLIWRLHAPEASNAVAISKDDARLLLSTTPLMEFNLKTGQPQASYEGNSGLVLSVAYSGDGKYVADGTWGYPGMHTPSVDVWDVATGKAYTSILLNQSATSVTFDNQDEIISGCLDGHIRFYDPITSGLTGGMQSGLVNTPLECGFMDNSPYIVSTGGDGSAFLWMDDSPQIHHFVPQARPLSVADMHFPVAANGPVPIIPTYAPTLISGSLLSSGTMLACGSEDGFLSLWNVSSERLLSQMGPFRTLSIGYEPIEGIQFAPLANKAVAWGYSSWLVNLPSTYQTHKQTNRVTLIRAMASVMSPMDARTTISPNARYAILSGTDAEEWDLLAPHPKLIKRLRKNAQDAVIAPNGRIAAVVYDGLIGLYSVVTNETPKFLPSRSSDVSSYCFSKDSRTIIAEYLDGNIRWYDTQTRQLIGQMKSGRQLRIQAVTNDRQFALGEGVNDAEVQLIDLKKKLPVGEIATLGDGTWVVADRYGRFDTNSIEGVQNVQWLIPDDPYRTYPLELFTREYFTPGLLTNLLRHESFSPIRSIADLNRAQPVVKVVNIIQETSNPNAVSVTVSLAAGSYEYERDHKAVIDSTGVYDLRLYRNGQIVRELPGDDTAIAAEPRPGDMSNAALGAWQKANLINLSNLPNIDGQREYTFHNILLPHDSGDVNVRFSAYAFNCDRVKSQTDTSTFRLPVMSPYRPRAYIITVGVTACQDRSWDLWFAAPGAYAVQELLCNALKSDYEIVPIPLISDYVNGSNVVSPNLATKTNIRAVLNILGGQSVGPVLRHDVDPLMSLRPAMPDDLVFLYVASHGYVDPDGTFYAIPADIGRATGISERFLNTALSQNGVKQSRQRAEQFLLNCISSKDLSLWLRDVDAGKIAIVLDSCHSGAVTGSGFKPAPLGDPGFGQLAYDKRLTILVATQSDSVARGMLEGLNQSFLTFALLHPKNTSRSFSTSDWLSQAAQQVPELYRKYAVEYPELLEDHQSPELLDFSPHPLLTATSQQSSD